MSLASIFSFLAIRALGSSPETGSFHSKYLLKICRDFVASNTVFAGGSTFESSSLFVSSVSVSQFLCKIAAISSTDSSAQVITLKTTL